MNETDSRICVYTALVGRYERLLEQPISNTDTADYICLTDDPLLESNTWEVRLIVLDFPSDLPRSQRCLKLSPERYIDKNIYDYMIYIDNSVLLKTPAHEIVGSLKLIGWELALMHHSFRERLVDEFVEVSSRCLDRQDLICRQLTSYSQEDPDVLNEKPFWAGLFIIRCSGENVFRLFRAWLMHVLVYSARDQLSLPYVLRRSPVVLDIIDSDNNDSEFHSWPRALDRKERAHFDPNRNFDQEIYFRSRILELASEAGLELSQAVPLIPDDIPHNLTLRSGGNSAGAGGKLYFGIEIFPRSSPMAAVQGDLENVSSRYGEVQGGLSFCTRPVGDEGQPLRPRLTIKSDGLLMLRGEYIENPTPRKGAIYFDHKAEKFKVSVDGLVWKTITIE